jgi:hypothetical protein
VEDFITNRGKEQTEAYSWRVMPFHDNRLDLNIYLLLFPCDVSFVCLLEYPFPVFVIILHTLLFSVIISLFLYLFSSRNVQPSL